MIVLKEIVKDIGEKRNKKQRNIFIYLSVNDDNLYEKEIGRQIQDDIFPVLWLFS